MNLAGRQGIRAPAGFLCDLAAVIVN